MTPLPGYPLWRYGRGCCYRTLQENTPRHIRGDLGEIQHCTLIADAAKAGWGAVLMHGGKVSITGRTWATPPFLIVEAEARAVRLALHDFAPHLKRKGNIVVGNTSLMGAPRKMHTKSYALAYELREVARFLRRHKLIASFQYVRSSDTPQTGCLAANLSAERTGRRGGTCKGERE